MDILISIRHEFAELIYSGKKKYELRKREPNIPIGTRCWIYEPLPIGKVTGYFVYGGCIKEDKYLVWKDNDMHKYFGVDENQYFSYYKNNEDACAWVVKIAEKFLIPFDREEYLGIRRAPQSYMFIDAQKLGKKYYF